MSEVTYDKVLFMVTEILIQCIRKRQFNVNRLESLLIKLWSIMEKAGSRENELLDLRNNGLKVLQWKHTKPLSFAQTIDQMFLHVFLAIPLSPENRPKIVQEIDRYFLDVRKGCLRSWRMFPNPNFVPGECDEMIAHKCGKLRDIVKNGQVVRLEE